MTKDQLRQIFRTMDGNRAQEIREAYYKAIEGLMTLVYSDNQKSPISPFSDN